MVCLYCCSSTSHLSCSQTHPTLSLPCMDSKLGTMLMKLLWDVSLQLKTLVSSVPEGRHLGMTLEWPQQCNTGLGTCRQVGCAWGYLSYDMSRRETLRYPSGILPGGQPLVAVTNSRFPCECSLAYEVIKCGCDRC